MERLTFVDEDGQVLFDNPEGFQEDVGFTIRELAENEEWETLDNIAQRLANCEQRLKYYGDLEEQGKLLKLPCAVGDMVYCIYSRYTKCSVHNQEFEESSCLGCESECDSRKEYYLQEQRVYSLDWIVTQIVNKHFGKLVFLTKSAAEQALKEMEGKK